MNSKIFKILTIGWSLAILFLTLKPHTGDEVFWLLKIQGMDKVAHFGLFFILTLLAFPAFKFAGKNVKWQIAISIIYGVLMSFLTEYGQQFVQGRSSDLLDFIADTLGVLCGLAFAKYLLFKNITI